MAEQEITVQGIADFLGIDLRVPAVEQPETEAASNRGRTGWPCAPDAPLRALLESVFPIQGGPASSMILAPEDVWCIAPDERGPWYRPAIQVQFVVRGWQSPNHQVLLPALPIPENGKVRDGNKTISSLDGLLATHERLVRSHAKSVATRLAAVERTPDSNVRTLLPHDVWTDG